MPNPVRSCSTGMIGREIAEAAADDARQGPNPVRSCSTGMIGREIAEAAADDAGMWSGPNTGLGTFGQWRPVRECTTLPAMSGHW